jgi:hypothetical protein
LAAGIGRSEASFIFEPGVEIILMLSCLGVSVLIHGCEMWCRGMDQHNTEPPCLSLRPLRVLYSFQPAGGRVRRQAPRRVIKASYCEQQQEQQQVLFEAAAH